MRLSSIKISAVVSRERTRSHGNVGVFKGRRVQAPVHFSTSKPQTPERYPLFPPEIRERMMDPRDPQLTLNQIATLHNRPMVIESPWGRIHYYHVGRNLADPLIELGHGQPDTAFTFTRLAPELVELGYRVLFYSMPGHGYSTRVPTLSFDGEAHWKSSQPRFDYMNLRHYGEVLRMMTYGFGNKTIAHAGHSFGLSFILHAALAFSPREMGLRRVVNLGGVACEILRHRPSLPPSELVSGSILGKIFAHWFTWLPFIGIKAGIDEAMNRKMIPAQLRTPESENFLEEWKRTMYRGAKKICGIPFFNRDIFEAIQKPTARVRKFLSQSDEYFDSLAEARERYFRGSGIPGIQILPAFDSYVRVQNSDKNPRDRGNGVRVAYCHPDTGLTYAEMVHAAWPRVFDGPSILTIVPDVSHMLQIQQPKEVAMAIHKGIQGTPLPDEMTH